MKTRQVTITVPVLSLPHWSIILKYAVCLALIGGARVISAELPWPFFLLEVWMLMVAGAALGLPSLEPNDAKNAAPAQEE